MFELTVESMTCGHCVGTVTKAVQELDANATVAIDLPTKKVRIDSDAALPAIVAAVAAAGYPVTASAAV
ncbi:heavy-metal-associated domain-containing protein [Massilia glaciei]|uniref:Copper chaperone n=1 Tax=Massilia glaciei TaxID=1524097 RepID=A0A2U2I6W6_9BURK|nr:cation transporter [Massilia glaciei]PWF55506.1 copper chaperone [Massilia glaciei]